MLGSLDEDVDLSRQIKRRVDVGDARAELNEILEQCAVLEQSLAALTRMARGKRGRLILERWMRVEEDLFEGLVPIAAALRDNLRDSAILGEHRFLLQETTQWLRHPTDGGLHRRRQVVVGITSDREPGLTTVILPKAPERVDAVSAVARVSLERVAPRSHALVGVIFASDWIAQKILLVGRQRRDKQRPVS